MLYKLYINYGRGGGHGGGHNLQHVIAIVAKLAHVVEMTIDHVNDPRGGRVCIGMDQRERVVGE